MADNTKIEWTDATWNPITGCSVVSPGCTNCYAMKLAGTRMRHHRSRAGLTDMTKTGPVWNGNLTFNLEWLDQPLRWKRPRRIFVCAHGDLFHENVPDEWIDRIFAVMALCPQHTFQVLTKRADRMREYFSRCRWHLWAAIGRSMDAMRWQNLPPIIGGDREPLPNVWLGVSVEDQQRADERIPDLVATPAAVRFLSCEPLLGSLHLKPRWLGGRKRVDGGGWIYGERPYHLSEGRSDWTPPPRLDWVIVGGESGPGARPMLPDWARSLRYQCSTAGVPFFFKQWGQWAPFDEYPSFARGWRILGNEGLANIGKKRAGNLLDGVVHVDFPA